MSFSANTSDNYYRILHPVCQTVADIIRQNLHNNHIKSTKCTPKGEAYSRLKLKFKEKNHTQRLLSSECSDIRRDSGIEQCSAILKSNRNSSQLRVLSKNLKKDAFMFTLYNALLLNERNRFYPFRPDDGSFVARSCRFLSTTRYRI